LIGVLVRPALGLDSTSELPTIFTSAEAEGLAVVTGGDYLILPVPDQAHERQQVSVDSDNSPRGLLGSTGVDNSDRAVVGGVSQSIPAGREGNGVDPAGGVIHKLAADGVEGQTFAPGSGLGLRINALDEGREHTSVGIGRAGGQQDRVGVPGDSGDGATDRFLEVLRHPPVVLLLEVANGDEAVTGADSELGLVGRPACKGSCTIDAKEDERRLVSLGSWLPDKGVAVWNSGRG